MEDRDGRRNDNRVQELSRISMPVPCRCEQERMRRHEQALAEQDDFEKYQRRLRYSGMEPRQMAARLDNYNPPNDDCRIALEFASKYADGFKHYRKKGVGLIFIGPNGSGKTHLAAGIAKAAIFEGFEVRFTRVGTLLQSLQNTFGKSEGSAQDILFPLENCDLLILDELTAERFRSNSGIINEWANGVIEDLIDLRVSRFLPIIVTTNNTEEQLRESGFSPRVISRIFGQNCIIKVAAPDYRRAGIARGKVINA